MWRRIAGVIVLVYAIAASLPAEPPLRVVLVQYAVDAGAYRSIDTFRASVAPLVARAVDEHRAEVVVFPEYINVFLLFQDFYTCIDASQTVRGALTCAGLTAEDLPEVIGDRAPKTNPAIRRMWAELAVEYGVAIVAGTTFARVGSGELRNRALVFDSHGRIVYRQDKVYLTPFEDRYLGLDAATVAAADTFTIDGYDLAISICRDSYFDAWETEFADADLWLDLRANGQRYSEQVRSRFAGALPERVAESDVDWGASTSLNGRFLDMLWQGPAFVVDADGIRVRESPVVDATRLMAFRIF